MHYDWKTTKIIHDERIKQITEGNQREPKIQIVNIRKGLIRLWSWILRTVRGQKAKRRKRLSVCKTHQTIIQQDPCI